MTSPASEEPVSIGSREELPKLVQEQFDVTGKASIVSHFAGKRLTFVFKNTDLKDASEYVIKEVSINGKLVSFEEVGQRQVKIARKELTKLSDNSVIEVILA